jgi:hypothetical protein
VLVIGDVPAEFSAHLAHFVEEASLPMVVQAVEEASQQSGMPISKIWANVRRLGDHPCLGSSGAPPLLYGATPRPLPLQRLISQVRPAL